MRRVIALLLCILFLAVPARAANAAQSVSATATVTENGACQVTVQADIRLDEPAQGLYFPLGTGINSASLNGTPAELIQREGSSQLSLSHLDGKTGVYSCIVTYEINTVVHTNDQGKQLVTVPLLCGFPYPVEEMRFAISLPTTFSEVPVFRSGYHGQDIERQMYALVTGTQIQGSLTQPLKDSETLFMDLLAPEGMFPPVQTFGGSMTFDAIAMALCAAAASLFWLVMLHALPRSGGHRSTPPEGICVGQVGTYLVHRNADLPLMVFQWAQLGYLTIHASSRGRVYLRQKMDMGNERSSFEQRCFRELFGARGSMEATSRRFQNACGRVAAYARRRSSGYRTAPGAIWIFRLLAALVGLFAGIAMADAVSTHHTWRFVLMGLFGAGGFAASWYIQEGMDCIHLRGKAPLKCSVALCLVFLCGSIACKCLLYGLATVAWSLLAGLAAAYGGIRSDNGRRIVGEILGLRKFLRKTDAAELQRILSSNRSYYYELAPYALAFGLDKTFAAKFGDVRLPPCTWLETGVEARTAAAWSQELRKTYFAMLREQPATPAERIFGK